MCSLRLVFYNALPLTFSHGNPMGGKCRFKVHSYDSLRNLCMICGVGCNLISGVSVGGVYLTWCVSLNMLRLQGGSRDDDDIETTPNS